MEMVKCKASLRSQCPCDWLKMQKETTMERYSTMVWKIYHVRGGGIRQLILTLICLL